MGLPAFDMQAFEAAREAVVARPLASATSLPDYTQLSDKNAAQIIGIMRSASDRLILSYEAWKVNAFAALATWRSYLSERAAYTKLEDLEIVIDFVREQNETTTRQRIEYYDLDQKAARRAREAYDDLRRAPIFVRKFMKAEARRFEKLLHDRGKTYDQILKVSIALEQKLIQYAEANRLRQAEFFDQDLQNETVRSVLGRPADVVGVAERTSRRLKQFPKTTAYLAK